MRTPRESSGHRRYGSAEPVTAQRAPLSQLTHARSIPEIGAGVSQSGHFKFETRSTI